ncbi:ThuA domain-containing protein [Nocardioides nitrophenolicus]|uniref:ThuA domain-containing protein n=1 Tax=Nocardioides nitrophenolicus TaxID=60489 RepID=UPI00195E511B|nr:ThuA domain-containing protein [Nocardioides nitrophenolicus]MBM7518550.1 PKD repeat protein/type 1 glutamine amidotransferase [Nocardioides nitrophenolicus]
MHTVITRLRGRVRFALLALLATLVALPVSAMTFVAPARAHDDHGDTDPFKALLFSKTAAFRHGNIGTGITAIQQLGVDHGFTVDATEDAGAFTDANLAQYDVVIWLSTTGDVLNEAQQGAFERYIQGGGGYAGIHAASDTEYDWPWYGQLVGSYFQGHPPGTPNATVKVEDPAHPSTEGMAPTWNRTDEWYNYRTNPRGAVHVLASLDETTYSGGNMGVEHPISWCQDYDGGRSWYTGMGHTDQSFADPQFLDHILGGIRTAAGVLDADCKATLQSSFQKVTLDDNTSNPMELAIAPDGRVAYIDRNGDVKLILANGNVVTAGHVNVYTGQEFGLLGIALDPDFETNHWVYLYYSPQGATPRDRVGRFTLDGNVLDTANETVIIDIPTQRDQCCHAGGAIEFDHDGNLYIATGDNTNPFDSSGYNPIDERAGRSAWDAQRTAGNTNSLSGKVLRIKPKNAGGYDVPTGNLFPAGTAQTRPEIYAMGFRNPFRIGLDEQTNKLLVADYGPDAGSVSATRGPNGRVEWNVLAEPGNYGWPYCVGNNTPYNDYDFATSTSGAAFDCAALVNNSPNNTGLTNLPPAKPATMWQSNNASLTGVPEIGASGAPMTSGTYDYDPDLVSDRKWPGYFDGKAIWADWNNSRLFTVQLNQAHTAYTDVSRFLPDLPMTRPHALQFGPDGALYMIEWGSGFNGNNTDSGIYRIDYVEGNQAPIAKAVADKTSGPAPLTVQFDGSESSDPEGSPITYEWDFDGDGTTDSTQATGSHVYTEVGDYTARLTVTDPEGRTAVSNLDIVVGNTAPQVELQLPRDGGFFEFGDTMRYKVVVTDPEDGEIDCDDVVVQPALGHDEHNHGYEQYHGCEGVIPLPGDEGHVGANIFGTITASYTDKGAPGASSLEGRDTIVVHTKRKEAEFFDTTGRVGSGTTGDPGVTTEETGDSAGGGQNVSYVDPGDWIAWDVMNLTNITEISMRVASPNAGAVWQVRQGAPDGPTVATIQVPNTGDWQSYQDVSAPVTGATADSGRLYFVQTAGGSNLNWIDFVGDGITENRRPVVTASADIVTGTVPLKVRFTASATDPDGDTPIDYDWVFGDGGTSVQQNPTHTFTEPGTYQVKVNATDSRGARGTKTIQVVVSDVPDCLNGRSDGFEGTSLDTTRWDSNVRWDGAATVSDGQLHIPLTASDLYGTGTNNLPNIVLQHLPGGAFTVTTKVSLAAVRAYQQAGLVVYGDDDNYLKLVYSGRSSTDNKANNVIQFAKEVGGTATETNSANLGAAFPDTVWLRLSSPDGLAVSASYSSDGTTFTSAGAARDLTSINEPRVGLLALANQAAGANITAHFDSFHITPDDTAIPCYEEGDTTAPVVKTTVTGDYAGEVTSLIDTPIGGEATLTSAIDEDGTGTATAKLDLTGLQPGAGYESHLHVGTCDTLGLHYLNDPAGPGNPPNELWPTNPGWSSGPRIVADAAGTSHAEATVPWAPRTNGRAIVVHKEGAMVACATLDLTGPGTVVLDATDDTALEQVKYRVGSGAWTEYDGPVVIDEPGSHTVRYLATDEAGNETSGSFKVVVPEPDVDPEAPKVELTTSPAPGAGGWWTGPVTVTAVASGGTGELALEYRRGDAGPWSAYAAPVVLSADGTHEVQVRATDAEGVVSETRSTTVRIDATAPTVSVQGLREGKKLSPAARKRIRVTASDATSGVAGQQLALDGRALTSPVVDAVLLKPGQHQLTVTVTDRAGNATVQTISFEVRVSYKGGKKLLDRLKREKRASAAVVRQLGKHLAAAERADRAGNTQAAKKALARFRSQAGKAGDKDAKAALKRLARELKRQL